LHSNGDLVIRKPTNHCRHAPSCDKVYAVLVVGEIRRKALDCEISTKNIVQQSMAQVLIIAAPALASTSALSQIVRRKRKAALAYDDKENEVNETSVVPRKLHMR